MLPGDDDYVLLGAGFIAVFGDGDRLHFPGEIVLSSCCLEILERPNESGVAVGSIGRYSDVVVVVLKLE
jgi:hypothetical protein